MTHLTYERYPCDSSRMTTTTPAAVIRFITADNAASLGYDDFTTPEWILETQTGEFFANLGITDETDVKGAQKAADYHIGGSGDWVKLPANYGTAYQLILDPELI